MGAVIGVDRDLIIVVAVGVRGGFVVLRGEEADFSVGIDAEERIVAAG